MQQYFCYTEKGLPKIKPDKPEKFEDLKQCFACFAPNPEIAEMAYKTNLKIQQWRSKC